MTFLTALAEIGSSRTLNKQWNVTLTKTIVDPHQQGTFDTASKHMIVATGLSHQDASHLADQLNDFLTDRPQLFTTCQTCGAEIVQPVTGRPRQYCSAACSQAAYRGRRSAATTTTK